MHSRQQKNGYMNCAAFIHVMGTLSNEDNRSSKICYDMDESQRHYADQKKKKKNQGTQEKVPSNSICMKFPNRQTALWGEKSGGGTSGFSQGVLSGMMCYVCNPFVMSGNTYRLHFFCVNYT